MFPNESNISLFVFLFYGVNDLNVSFTLNFDGFIIFKYSFYIYVNDLSFVIIINRPLYVPLSKVFNKMFPLIFLILVTDFYWVYFNYFLSPVGHITWNNINNSNFIRRLT